MRHEKGLGDIENKSRRLVAVGVSGSFPPGCSTQILDESAVFGVWVSLLALFVLLKGC